MPWLVATALIHSLAVTEQRGAFRAWTILLAIFGFSLSLLGTFLVRSGVLVSVHAFANDPARGVFILAFLGVVIGSALALYASRAGRLSGGGSFELVSRETLLLTNNVLLTVACASVLLGTLYPLVLDALALGKVSVGPPYFERVFVPLMLPLAILIGVGPLTRWKSDALHSLTRRVLVTLGASTILGVILVLAATSRPGVMVIAAVAVALWVIGATAQGVWERVRSTPSRVAGMRRFPRSFIGMSFAHLGVGVFIIGVTASSVYTVEKDVRMRPGDTQSLAGFEVEFGGASTVAGPNYQAQRGTFLVRSDGEVIATLHPEKRTYASQAQPMTEAAIHAGLVRDFYVAMGDALGDGAWTVRLYHKPLQRWIWLGPLLMAFGGLLAASDRRYRRPIEKPAEEAPPRVVLATSAPARSR
jgi:cytochrome c-type biogenesis protein CcmF